MVSKYCIYSCKRNTLVGVSLGDLDNCCRYSELTSKATVLGEIDVFSISDANCVSAEVLLRLGWRDNMHDGSGLVASWQSCDSTD